MTTETSSNMCTHSILSTIIGTIGFFLMAFTIYTDSEPGALPLLLVLTGLVWFVFAKHKSAKEKE